MDTCPHCGFEMVEEIEPYDVAAERQRFSTWLDKTAPASRR